jgi:hypothetical protein
MIVVGVLGAGETSAVAEIARRAARSGARVEVVGVVAGDSTSDQALFELATAGVGHATVVRSARAVTEPADLELALRYLPDIRCVVLVAPPARLVETAVSGADYAGAPLVVVGPLDAEGLAVLDGRASIVLDPPAHDPDGTFAGFVGALAIRLDAGDEPQAAFRSTVAELSVDPA